MRNPVRKALYCLILVVTAAGLIWFGAERHDRVDGDWSATGPILLGFALLPFPLVFLIQALFAVRGQAKLLAGIGVIARWQIYPGEWKQFTGLDERRSAEDFDLVNDLWIRKAPATGPVEVIVGEKSAMVDGSYHSLNPRGLPELRAIRWLEGPPTCLEFSLRYPRSRYGGTITTTLRIPVPPSARPDARRVVAHYDRLTMRTPGIALRNPSLTFRICALLILGAAAAGSIAWLTVNWANRDVQIGLLIGLLVLLTIAAAAALLALATYLLTRRT